MKLVSFSRGDGAEYGIVTGDGIIPVDGDFAARFPSIRAILEAGAVSELADWASGRSETVALDGITYLPPLHDGEKVLCIGVNYPKRHPVEGDIPPPEDITVFAKLPGSVVGHRAALQRPADPIGETMDYEGELVLVIGREGRMIPREKAFDHIGGYTIMNDGSIRAWQKRSLMAGKNFVATGACGPWMVTADEIADVNAMMLSTRLNGEEVQSTTAGKMIFDIPTLVEYVSTFVHLKPGDVISTGSPEGSGGSRIPQRFLTPGDELAIEWSGIGVLENRVEAA